MAQNTIYYILSFIINSYSCLFCVTLNEYEYIKYYMKCTKTYIFLYILFYIPIEKLIHMI